MLKFTGAEDNADGVELDIEDLEEDDKRPQCLSGDRRLSFETDCESVCPKVISNEHSTSRDGTEYRSFLPHPSTLREARMCFVHPAAGGSKADSMQGSGINYVQLPHPSNGSPCGFLLDTRRKGDWRVYELTHIERGVGPTSVLIEDNLKADAQLTTVTMFDPLFLLLPYLERARGNAAPGRFCLMSQVCSAPVEARGLIAVPEISTTVTSQSFDYSLADESLPQAVARALLTQKSFRRRIMHLVDVEHSGNPSDPLIRFSDERTVEEIGLKMRRMADFVNCRGLWLSEAAMVTHSSAGEDECDLQPFVNDKDSVNRLIWAATSVYLCPKMRQRVASANGFDTAHARSNTAMLHQASPTHLSGNSSSGLKTSSAKPKRNRSQRDADRLGSRDVKGAKLLTAFFTKK